MVAATKTLLNELRRVLQASPYSPTVWAERDAKGNVLLRAVLSWKSEQYYPTLVAVDAVCHRLGYMFTEQSENTLVAKVRG